jgi:general stress protein YciG
MDNQEEYLVISDIPIEEGEIREYTIYHIPGVKVGCTVNFKARKMQYEEGTVFDILEVIECTALVASDREWHWADKLGYERGTYYADCNWNAILTAEQRSELGKKNGKKNIQTGVASRKAIELISKERKREISTKAWELMSEEKRSKISATGFQAMSKEKNQEIARMGGRKTVETGGMELIRRASIESPNHVSRQLNTCPYCDFKCRGPGMSNHIKNCEMKDIDILLDNPPDIIL